MRHRPRVGRVCAAVLVLLLGCLARPAIAWDPRGHEVVGHLAERYLTPVARARVAEILGGGGLAEVASWADQIRLVRQETRDWHFINIPVGAAGYDPSWCPPSGCVLRALVESLGLLAHREAGAEQRLDALRFVVHFTGDLHQPLHVANHDDRGGNQLRVQLDGRPTNLHAVWDADLPAALGSDARAIAGRLAQRADAFPGGPAAIGAGNVVDWMSGSFAAGQQIHRALGGGRLLPPRNEDRMLDLPADYAAQNGPIAAELLMQAGIRLAVLLNATLR